MVKRNFIRSGLVAFVLVAVLGCAAAGHQAAVSSGEQSYDEQRAYAPQGPLGPGSIGWDYEYYWGNNSSFQYRGAPGSYNNR